MDGNAGTVDLCVGMPFWTWVFTTSTTFLKTARSKVSRINGHWMKRKRIEAEVEDYGERIRPGMFCFFTHFCRLPVL